VISSVSGGNVVVAASATNDVIATTPVDSIGIVRSANDVGAGGAEDRASAIDRSGVEDAIDRAAENRSRRVPSK
jgi:hypothetical protein